MQTELPSTGIGAVKQSLPSFKKPVVKLRCIYKADSNNQPKPNLNVLTDAGLNGDVKCEVVEDSYNDKHKIAFYTSDTSALKVKSTFAYGPTYPVDDNRVSAKFQRSVIELDVAGNTDQKLISFEGKSYFKRFNFYFGVVEVQKEKQYFFRRAELELYENARLSGSETRRTFVWLPMDPEGNKQIADTKNDTRANVSRFIFGTPREK